MGRKERAGKATKLPGVGFEESGQMMHQGDAPHDVGKSIRAGLEKVASTTGFNPTLRQIVAPPPSRKPPHKNAPYRPVWGEKLLDF
jgi:hypothetical protein